MKRVSIGDVNVDIHTGDALSVLRGLEPESVHCCVTSPPYWGLRSYLPDGHADKAAEAGAEPTPEAYVENLVAVFREVRRVLRKDGTLWLNLGDSYNGSGGAGGDYNAGGLKDGQPKYPGRKVPTLKPKDLVGIPWSVAFALRADGWYLRSEIIWNKPNPIPESVRDRPTRAHEQIFLLSKSGKAQFWTHRDRDYSECAAAVRARPAPDYRWFNAETEEEVAVEPDGWRESKEWSRRNLWRGCDYFYDGDAIAEPLNCPDAAGIPFGGVKRAGGQNPTYSGNEYDASTLSGRNKRTVWTVTTRPFKEAHFATFPPKLIEPCILAGTSATCTVLDPFFGAGTTGLVAVHAGRHCIGIELSEEYADMAARRIQDSAPLFAGVSDER